MPLQYYYESDSFIFSHLTMETPQDFPLHNHDVYEIIFLKKGDISYMADGREYRPSRNSLLLTPPFKNHSVHFNSPSSYERYDIVFDESKLAPCTRRKLPEDIVVINFDSYSMAAELFRKMDYYYENFEGEDMERLLTLLLEELIHISSMNMKKEMQDIIFTANSVVQNAVNYIEKNINTPLNVDMVCNELFISKSHLHHLFMKHLRTSPRKYIASRKMALAQRELRLGRKATDIYENCGFAEYSTFYRTYKSYFGYAPSEEGSMDIIRRIQS